MNLPNMIDAKKRTNNKIVFNNFVLPEKYKNIIKNKKYYIKTYGCQMNEHDSEEYSALLEYTGYIRTDVMEDADLILLNTCSIRENANNKVFGFLGRVKHLKEEKKNIVVGLAGCMAQEEVIAKQLLEKYKWLNFVIGTHNIESILDNILASNISTNIDVYSIEGDVKENLIYNRNSKYSAYVNIMYGCDKFCTYCIVPYTRGKQRSRKKEDIIKEVIALKNNGYREVILLGQNVNAYGKDLALGYGMSELLQEVADTKIDRIRFVTSHPWDFTYDMINIMKNNENIMPQLHLPVQSGSSKILKLMGRRYTKEEYLELYNTLKREIPGICISTDIIVGFPNESDEDFDETLDLVEKCQFDYAFTFIFSKRVGTPAYNMDDKITLKEKEERLQKLNTKINKFAKISNDKYLNEVVSVLLLGPSEKDNNTLYGYSKHFKLVNVKAPKELIGKIVKVKITDVKTWSLDGEYIS